MVHTHTNTHICNICVYHCLVWKSWFKCVIFLESSLASEKITLPSKNTAKVHFAQHRTSKRAVMFPSQTHTMGHMTSALISHSCTWWNKAALLSLTLVGSLACFHNRGGNTITTCMKEIVFSRRQHSPSKTWQWQKAPPLQGGSGVSRCVWVRSPQLKKICKKKSMYWRGEGTTKTDTDGSWQQFVLSLEQRRKREERRTSFRRGVAEVRSGLRFGETEEALKFRWGNKGALLTDFQFFFFPGANVKVRSAVQKQSLFYSRPTARGGFRKQTAHK